MSLIHTNAKSITADAFVSVIADLPHSASAPCIVGIAGGSASGKTTIAERLTQQFDHATLFSQDLFQLGKDFDERKTSPYKWDDPRNFDFAGCARALSVLQSGGSVTVPAFDVVENRRIGTTTIEPAHFIFWEGIYALGSQELRSHLTASVFVDTPYEIRFLRRIKRFFAMRSRGNIDDYSTPARQMLTFVWRAEKDYVLRQRDLADYCIPFSEADIAAEVASFTTAMKEYVPQEYRTPLAGHEIKRILSNGLTFALKPTAFEIYKGEECLYAAPIESELASGIRDDFDAIFSI